MPRYSAQLVLATGDKTVIATLKVGGTLVPNVVEISISYPEPGGSSYQGFKDKIYLSRLPQKSPVRKESEATLRAHLDDDEFFQEIIGAMEELSNSWQRQAAQIV